MRWRLIALVMFALLTSMGCRLLVPDAGEQPAASPLEPLPNEDSMVRGEVFINSTELLIMESYPLQISMVITGDMPTPCHHLRVEVREPDAESVIAVEAYSLVDPTEICAQVLQSFEENISLGSYPDGSYTVTLNGEEVGSFTQ